MKASSARRTGPADEKQRILVADDDPVTLQVLSRYLTAAGYEVVTAANGREATQKLNSDMHVALFDLEMPHASGLDCLRHAHKTFPDLSVIMVSGKGEIQDAVAAMKEGAFDYLTKPFERDELVARVNQASWAARLARDNQGLREAVAPSAPACDFVAQSPLTQQLLRQIGKVATLDSTVLLTGESGTGKTTVARMIHQMGPRASGPFVTVNCASLPRDLVEAELFGHAKGAFTGAVHDRPGRAEIADGGTLFLDEIGDLPLELQPKLLTFLQDRSFQRIGSNKVYNVDVRLITATHQNLAVMCRDRRFREDLYFRLNVIALHIPALRERAEDVPGLIQLILTKIARRREQPPLRCDEPAELALRSHSWPGNVRELENVLERASAFCDAGVITPADLLFPTLASPISAPAPSVAPAPVAVAPATVAPATLPPVDESEEATVASDAPTLAGRTLDELERQAIVDTLIATGGNKAEAARRLGISEKSIYNKMKRFQVEQPE